VTGAITVYNPAAIAQTVTVTDQLDDGTHAIVDCGDGTNVVTIPAGEAAECDYGANPEGRSATLNVATATAAGNEPQTGDASIDWEGQALGDDEVTLSDPRFEFEELISGTEDLQVSERLECPTDGNLYVDGKYSFPELNEAFLTGPNTDEAASATVTVNCTLPQQKSTFLIIDEDSIDNGIRVNKSGGLITPDGPNFFSDKEVNDDRPGTSQRSVLRYFADNPGKTITVVTGQTGDEGWFAPTCLPRKWLAGSSSSDNRCLTGAERQTAMTNYFSGPVPAQSRLDKIPAVMPLRALGLNSLIGHSICAVVYDSDVSINYDSDKLPFTSGNLQGETLGIAAFRVDAVTTLNGFSSSTLPQVTLTILDAAKACGPTALFNAPVPKSSSEPNDRVAPGSPVGYRALKAWATEGLFF
jgi:hypothetical protein